MKDQGCMKYMANNLRCVQHTGNRLQAWQLVETASSNCQAVKLRHTCCYSSQPKSTKCAWPDLKLCCVNYVDRATDKMWARQPQMAHPLAFMRAEAVQMCNNIKRDIRASGIVQGSWSFFLAHLQCNQPAYFAHQLASKACISLLCRIALQHKVCGLLVLYCVM